MTALTDQEIPEIQDLLFTCIVAIRILSKTLETKCAPEEIEAAAAAVYDKTHPIHFPLRYQSIPGHESAARYKTAHIHPATLRSLLGLEKKE